MTLRIPVLFDLDGVIVDSHEFEKAVMGQIVRVLAMNDHISLSEAENQWTDSLRTSRNDPRWHDYALHCARHGLGDVWITAHRNSSGLLRRMPFIEDALATAADIGPLWIASDATRWVVDFKLETAEITHNQFAEIFCLDRCGTHKGTNEYWSIVNSQIEDKRNGLIYIDNRVDRLSAASAVVTHAVFILVHSADHPSSLGLGTVTGDVPHGHFITCTPIELAGSLCKAKSLISQSSSKQPLDSHDE